MNNFTLKTIIAVAFLTSCSFFSVASFAANNSNQVDFVLISDPHVDIKSQVAVNINPKPVPFKPLNILNNSRSNKGNDLDAPSFVTLMTKLSAKLPQLTEKPSFMVVVGDLPSHNAGHDRTPYLQSVFHTLYEKFNPLPLFYTFGNNDSIGRDYGPFTTDQNSPFTIFKSITTKGGLLSTGEECKSTSKLPCIINQNETYGYYSAYIGDHLKLISLNSVVFDNTPNYSPAREGDAEQLHWLNQELANSQTNKEQVILTMHVPPSEWVDQYNTQFKSLITNHPDVVIGLFAAHFHTDELLAIKAETQTIPIIISAGLATSHGNSSSFKTIDIKRKNETSPWEIGNYVTFYFKGSKADVSSITKYYDFNSAFCSSKNNLLTACVNSQLEKSDGNHYQFNLKAHNLLNEHLYANPTYANPNAFPATFEWVLNY